ncbi:hypothetical protein PR002_g12361 [Phytophthora rubi]|uniref:CBM1 domain-containing protein n=1 Tax=Phytophthora rubi TaxID=129364 RepID=A0A6A3LYR2_9STRA|nr:hypothetical protein PR002_g12361 [Phytophthora rubi]
MSLALVITVISVLIVTPYLQSGPICGKTLHAESWCWHTKIKAKSCASAAESASGDCPPGEFSLLAILK